MSVAAILACAGTAWSWQDGGQPPPDDGWIPPAGAEQPEGAAEEALPPILPPVYPVSRVVIVYDDAEEIGADDRPSPQALVDSIVVTLGRTAEGYVEPRPDVETVQVALADLGSAERPVLLNAAAVKQVLDSVPREFNRRGIISVVAYTRDLNSTPEGGPQGADRRPDLREEGVNELRILVRTARVTQVRTLAFGDRLPAEERLNHPAHARIRANAPVQSYRPGVAGEPAEHSGLLRRDLIDAYTARLSRHPGREVSTAVSAADDGRGVALDLLVSENRPWYPYFQVSNTGTEETNEWRERFGFVHTQLTGRDDILSLDYTTGGFEDAHAVVASYEARFLDCDRLRWKVYGTWNQFTASDVGLAGEEFEGDGWTAGGELIWNVYQRGEWFGDVFGGARWQHVRVENKAVAIEGEEDFFQPYFGARVERDIDTAKTSAAVTLEFNVPSIAGTDEDELEKLGRLQTDEDWVVLQWHVAHSFFLDPFLFGDAWRDVENGNPTLAHELALSFRGQHAFDYRLIPNQEQVAGGFYSVRGYEESEAAGDTVLMGSAEYRFYVARALGFDPEPGSLFGQNFRYRPQAPYGKADWDVILRGFFDIARVENSDRLIIENDQTLMGTGVGVEVRFRHNVSVRVDYGIALEDIEGEDGTEAGDGRLHFVATIVF